MGQNKRLIAFAVVVITNVVLKCLFCDYTPFSFDEIISVKDTVLDFGHIKHEAEWDNNPPFYYYCLWVWHKLFSVNEFNSRLLSVIFVSLAIGFSYLFAIKYFDKRTAIYTVLLLSVSNFITYYAQETRTYSLVLMLAVISSMQFMGF
ncbi:MAG: glycosyltransferase family 39 protein, partial [Bacteroidia bacterium]|nr:glycosyltransferase family 39 protein [Bacteroidia bacterium]